MSNLDAPAGKRKLPTNEAASYLGVSTSMLNKMRHFGGGPKYISIGSRVVYDPADLDQWCEGRKRASTSEASLQGAA